MMENKARIWSFDEHFCHEFNRAAKELCARFDNALQPKVYLIGVQSTSEKDAANICVTPNSNELNPSAFKNIRSLAQRLAEADEENHETPSVPIGQQWQEQSIIERAFAEAIEKIVRKELGGEFDVFVSIPKSISNFDVSAVLIVDKASYDSYYSLSRYKGFHRRYYKASYIESAFWELLNEFSSSLSKPEGLDNTISHTADELLRRAGIAFVNTVAKPSSSRLPDGTLYDNLCKISSLNYEGAECVGRLLVVSSDHKDIRLDLEFDQPIPLTEHRKVRKIVEMVSTDNYVMCNSECIYGLGTMVKEYNAHEETVFQIRVNGHHKWEILHDRNPMIVVEYNVPRMPKEKVDRDKFYSDFGRIFKSKSHDQINEIWDLVNETIKQRHGTMLVISDLAQKEARRLSKQSFMIKPIKLAKSQIQHLTSIDGAVLADSNLKCYAVGAILDGLSTEKGDSSRGARYNSALRYLESPAGDEPMAIIIVSEDGMVNVLPDLKPQVKRKSVDHSIAILKSLEGVERVTLKEYYDAMEQLEQFRFYFDEKDCQLINQLSANIRGAFKRGTLIRVFREYFPDKEMTPEYYL